MTEKFFDDYSAREFLDWLENEEATEYLNQEIEMVDGESTIIETFDMERLKTNFIHHIKRYSVVKRGKRLYLHDNRSCNDIMQFRIDNDDEVEVQNYVNHLCNDLNNRQINFIGKKYRCD